jgi:hypothetical protein
MGGMAMLGTNDMLSNFVAGNVLTWVSKPKKKRAMNE